MDTDFRRGLRTLYYLVVLFFWFFGPEFLIVGTLLLTWILYRYDYEAGGPELFETDGGEA